MNTLVKLNEPALSSIQQNQQTYNTIEVNSQEVETVDGQLRIMNKTIEENNDDVKEPVNIQIGSGEETLIDKQSFGEAVGNECTINMLPDDANKIQ